MNRKLRALGLALVAVFAMSALSATTASAETFHAGAEHGVLDGSNVGEEEFITKAGTVKCKTAHYTGTYVSTSSTQTVKPHYTSCTAFGFVNATIDVGTCEYRFNTPTGTTGTVDIINCTTPLRVTAFNCEVTVGNQTGLNHVVYSNHGPTETAGGTTHPDDVHVTPTINNITYTQHSKSFPGCTNGTFTDGVYKGTNTVRATDTFEKYVSLTIT